MKSREERKGEMGGRHVLPLIVLLADMTSTVVIAIAADYLAVGGLVGSSPLAGFLF